MIALVPKPHFYFIEREAGASSPEVSSTVLEQNWVCLMPLDLGPTGPSHIPCINTPHRLQVMTAPTQVSLLPKELAEGRGASLLKPRRAARRKTSFLFPPSSQGWGCREK